MDKEKEIVKLAEIINEVAFIQAHEIDGDGHLCEIVAKAIIEAGYGDTKQAVREFAKKVNQRAQALKGDGFDEYNEGFERGVRETLYLIDELLAEVTGE